MAKTTKAAASSSSQLVELPTLSQLFTDSWDRLKLVGWRLVGLYLLMTVVVSVIFLVGLFGGGAALLGAGGFSNMQTTLMNPGTWLNFGALFLVLIILVSFLANAFTAAIILAVDEGAKRTPFGALLKQGFQLVIPLFVVGLATQFLVLGGLFLFVIPGIIMGILLSFAMYEVILGNARGMTALKNSVSVVKQNFWGILGRWAALIGVQMLVMIVFSALAEANEGTSAVIDLLSSIVSMFFSLYSLVYGVLLYRAARAHTNLAEGKMTWMWPVAILGWVIGGALLFAAAQIARSAYNEIQNNPESLDRWMMETATGTDSAEQQYLYEGDYLPDSQQIDAGEYGTLYEQFLQDGELSDEDLNQLYQEALQMQQQPTQ